MHRNRWPLRILYQGRGVALVALVAGREQTRTCFIRKRCVLRVWGRYRMVLLEIRNEPAGSDLKFAIRTLAVLVPFSRWKGGTQVTSTCVWHERRRRKVQGKHVRRIARHASKRSSSFHLPVTLECNNHPIGPVSIRVDKNSLSTSAAAEPKSQYLHHHLVALGGIVQGTGDRASLSRNGGK